MSLLTKAIIISILAIITITTVVVSVFHIRNQKAKVSMYY